MRHALVSRRCYHTLTRGSRAFRSPCAREFAAEELYKTYSLEGNTVVQERQRAEDDRRAVAAAHAEAERERLSRERLEQQVTGHHTRVSHASACCFLWAWLRLPCRRHILKTEDSEVH